MREEAGEAVRQEPEHGQRDEREEQREHVHLVGVEDRDDRDGQQVVHHGKREQEEAERAGQVRAHDREHRHCKRDIGGGGDRPAAQGLGVRRVDRRVDQRGDDDAAHGRRDRHRRLPEVPQVTRDELALELEAHEEEEDREQPVRGPGAEAEVQVPRLVAHVEVPQREVALRKGGVGPDDGEDGGDHQEDAGHGLAAQDVLESGEGAARGVVRLARGLRMVEETGLRDEAGGLFLHHGLRGSGLTVGRGGRVVQGHGLLQCRRASRSLPPTRLPGTPASKSSRALLGGAPGAAFRKAVPQQPTRLLCRCDPGHETIWQ